MMLTCLVSIAVEIGRGHVALWRTVPAFLMALVAIGPAKQRTVPNAVRIGRDRDDSSTQSALIQRVYADHRISFALITGVLVLHLLPH